MTQKNGKRFEEIFEKLITVAEAATLLNRSEQDTWPLIRKGVLSTEVFGAKSLIKESSVQQFLKDGGIEKVKPSDALSSIDKIVENLPDGVTLFIPW